MTRPAITAGDRAFVRVAVATGWRRPDAPRRVDAPALEAPPRLREWLASMTVREAAGLLGIADTQVLLGEPVSVLTMHGGWARVAIPQQPTPVDPSGYPVWIPVAQLTVQTPEPASAREEATVVTPTAWLADRDGHRLLEVSFGTRLPVRGRGPGAIELGLPDGATAWVDEASVMVVTAGEAPRAASAHALVETARSLLGVPYLWAGVSGFGFDCSGLAHAVYRLHGVTLPRDSPDQAGAGAPVERGGTLPGDLLFFARDGRVHHVAIDLGDGLVLEAPYEGLPVRISRLRELSYADEYASARRVLGRPGSG